MSYNPNGTSENLIEAVIMLIFVVLFWGIGGFICKKLYKFSKNINPNKEKKFIDNVLLFSIITITLFLGIIMLV